MLIFVISAILGVGAVATMAAKEGSEYSGVGQKRTGKK